MKKSLLIWIDEKDKKYLKEVAKHEGIQSMSGFMIWLLHQYKNKKPL